MIFDRFLLGDSSIVDITTTQTVREIKLKLASTYSESRSDPGTVFFKEPKEFNTEYVFYFKKNSLKLYFSKDQNRNFSGPYPCFAGCILDKGNHRLIKGRIGQSPWINYFTIGWFVLVTFIYIGWSVKGEGSFPQGKIALYLILFGLVGFLIGLVRTRSKVWKMREEVDRIFSTATNNLS